MATKEKKGRKFGRNLKRASHASQAMRSARNKRLNIEAEAKLQGRSATTLYTLPIDYTRRKPPLHKWHPLAPPVGRRVSAT